MLFATPKKTIREVQSVIEELRAKDIRTHAQLISSPDIKERVKQCLKDVRKSLDSLQNEIIQNIDMPQAAYNERNVDNLRTQQRLLMMAQDELLKITGRA